MGEGWGEGSLGHQIILKPPPVINAQCPVNSVTQNSLTLTPTALSCLMRVNSGMIAVMNFIRASRVGRTRSFVLIGVLLLTLPARAASDKLPGIPKWSRFETAFRSSVTYNNPVQECALKVAFVSPAGATNDVEGFW